MLFTIAEGRNLNIFFHDPLINVHLLWRRQRASEELQRLQFCFPEGNRGVGVDFSGGTIDHELGESRRPPWRLGRSAGGGDGGRRGNLFGFGAPWSRGTLDSGASRRARSSGSPGHQRRALEPPRPLGEARPPRLPRGGGLVVAGHYGRPGRIVEGRAVPVAYGAEEGEETESNAIQLWSSANLALAVADSHG